MLTFATFSDRFLVQIEDTNHESQLRSQRLVGSFVRVPAPSKLGNRGPDVTRNEGHGTSQDLELRVRECRRRHHVSGSR